MNNWLLFFFLLITVGILILSFISYLSKRRKVSDNKSALYRSLLEKEVFFYQHLNDKQKDRFLKAVLAFLERTHIEGVGTRVEDIDRILIAASAIIPIFAFDGWHYPHLSNVILYPETFNEAFQYQGNRRNTLGMVGDGFMNGQMILSKKALRAGFSKQKQQSNTAIHEFVHLLDKSDGSIDGVPELLLGKANISPWIHLIHHEMRAIEQGKSDIDPYASTNTAEFFAVAAEYFFTDPKHLQVRHPQLFAMLNQIFHHPAA